MCVWERGERDREKTQMTSKIKRFELEILQLNESLREEFFLMIVEKLFFTQQIVFAHSMFARS